MNEDYPIGREKKSYKEVKNNQKQGGREKVLGTPGRLLEMI